MRPFKVLRVWQAGHSVALHIYAATGGFPRDEIYGLTNQMRRSAASIPTNIAEGSVRSDCEFHQFLRIALGSATELEYQLLLARDLGYLSEVSFDAPEGELLPLKRMLVTFLKTVKDSPPQAQRQGPMASGQGPVP
ncbi:MAG: four helix bundle protein [Tepidiformaceae bacterium]